MKRAPSPLAAARGSATSDSTKQIAIKSLSDPCAPAQALSDGIHVATFWKSPRNRREAIQVTLREYQGVPFLDARIFAMNATGHMTPTKRGIAVGIRTLPAFSKAIGDGLRKAAAMGLLTGVSS